MKYWPLNTTVNEDEDGTYQDWVELYNTGATAVNLNGYGLTDDATLPHKWTFPNVTLGAGQYLLVWCDDKNRAVAGNPLPTNWKISSAGETITLTDVASATVSSAPAAALPQNVSYGHLPNGTGAFVFLSPVTPGAGQFGSRIFRSIARTNVLARFRIPDCRFQPRHHDCRSWRFYHLYFRRIRTKINQFGRYHVPI